MNARNPLILIFLVGSLHAAEAPAPAAIITRPEESGRQIWSQRCRMCHASPFMLKTLGVSDPDKNRPWRSAAETPALFRKTVREGRHRMPAFLEITDQQLDELRTYLISSSTPTSPVCPR